MTGTALYDAYKALYRENVLKLSERHRGRQIGLAR
jgi:hypothetical protein